ncbi:synaptotagmin-15 [Odontesthes bonariensis]
MRLMRYDYVVKHVPGKGLWTADTLSCAPLILQTNTHRDKPARGHQRAKDTVWWPGHSSQLNDVVLKCKPCIQERQNIKEPLMPTEMPDRPWQTLGADLFTLRGKTYLLVVDYFSSDNGPQFSGSYFEEFAAKYGFVHITSSPKFPQSNGEAERAVQTVKNLLTKASDPYLALLAYRATPLQNGYSPAELLMGRRLRTTVPTLPTLLNPALPDFNVVEAKEKEKRRNDVRHRARTLRPLSPGEDVWVTDARVQGTVISQHNTPRSFIVQGPQGTLRRNRHHLVPLQTDSGVVDAEPQVGENPPTPKAPPPTSPTTETVWTRSGRELIDCSDQVLLLAVGLSVGLLLLLLLSLMVCCLWRKKNRQSQYQELLSTVPSVPVCPAPVILVSQGSWATDIPFTLPPRFVTQNNGELKNDETEDEEEKEGMKTKALHDILAHRGSLSVRSWYPVGSVLAGLYSTTPLNEVVAPPPGLATRLCFSVEYRHSSEQVVVSLLRLGNLPPHFHGNVTLVELRLLPDDRRPRQAKARGTGPDPEFNDCFFFQVSGVCVPLSTLSVCVLSVEKDGKRHAVGRVLFPLEGELGHAGRVLWRDLEPEEDTQCSELGDMQISLSYSSSLQRLSVVVLQARGLQLLTDAGVCVQVSLRIHTQVAKMKRTCVVRGEKEPLFNYRMTFKLRPQHLDEACLRFELQQPNDSRSEPPALLGVLVLGPFMYARGHQLQHWMDMVNTAEKPVKLWHGLGRAT